MQKPMKSKKTVKIKAYGIVTSENKLCEWTDHNVKGIQQFNVYSEKKNADKALAPFKHMGVYRIVPCSIRLEITRPRRKNG